MSRLIKSYGTKNNKKHHFCSLCLSRHASKEKLVYHMTYCKKHRPQALYCKDEDKKEVETFKKIHVQLKSPFTIYADFEAYLQLSEE